MFCSKCGNKLNDGDDVCGRCGAPAKRLTPAAAKNAVSQPSVSGSAAAQNMAGGSAAAQNTTGGSAATQNTTSGSAAAQNAAGGSVAPQNTAGGSAQQTAASDTIPVGNPPRKGRGPLIGLLVFLLILALAGTAGVAYLNRDILFGADSGDADAENGTDSADSADSDADGDADSGTAAGGNADGAGAGTAQTGGTGESSADSAQTEENAGSAILAGNELSGRITALNQSGETALSIDVFADNYTPGTRNINFSWDRILFYTLEDVDPASAADGKINSYDITRKLLKNAKSGNKMEFEIYKNPSSGKVNKIVSIEYLPNRLEITDYYYDDTGKVSFIFVRDDSNYIPSYAVPSKDGQRFYFNSDSLVKWRVVSQGAQINYVIGSEAAKNNPAGGVVLYSNLDNDKKAAYDATEKQMINAAYNVYNTVLNSEGLSEITGYVYDDSGLAKTGAQVALYDGSGELYRTTTDTAGFYGIILPSESRNYRLKVSDSGCAPAELYDIAINDTVLSDYQDTVYLVKESNTPYNVELRLFDALNYSADGLNLERLSDAAVYIRNGCNHRDGGVVAQGLSDINGEMQLSLKPGMYTAEVIKQGYDNLYYNFAVRENMQLLQINVSPSLASGEVRIVLTWGEYPEDLDSHLFTPYDTAMGDSTYHIWYGNREDGVGDNLDVDDTSSYGPETMTIPVLKNGLYKYYVADFTNCVYDNFTSNQMSLSGATVNVYTENGLTATFHVPANVPGVIWEVFEIRNGNIVPIQRYYSNVDGKSWWHNDK